ncbi:MAG: cytochrome c [Rhizobiaceae bacterium]|nr:cytochrome c [Rhizobiaceae bacterium]
MFQKIRANFVPMMVVLFLVGGVAAMFSGNSGNNADPRTNSRVDVSVPELTELALEGEALFNENCAACHGKDAGGSDNGPSLIHTTYNPGHHPDEAFYFAAKNGVRAHHWGFGNMPKVEGIKQSEVTKIIRYIRDLQFANGIVTKPHIM